jgi:hypothetical protein
MKEASEELSVNYNKLINVACSTCFKQGWRTVYEIYTAAGKLPVVDNGKKTSVKSSAIIVLFKAKLHTHHFRTLKFFVLL